MSSADNTSSLRIEVVSVGVKEASTQLSGLGTSAKNSEDRVKKLTDTITNLMGSQKTGTAVAQKYTEAIKETFNIMAGGAGATTGLTNATSQLAAAMVMLTQSLNAVQSSSNRSRQAVAQHTNAMRDAHAMARGLSGSLGALWVTYGNMVPLATGLAIGAAFKNVIKVGADVENVLEGIRVRGEESTENINKMRTAILDLGKGAFAPTQVAEAFQTLIMAGLKAEQALAGVGDALNLAVTGGTSIEKAAYTLVQVGTAMGYTANGFSAIGDTIAKTAAVSMSSVETLSEAFKQASSVGKLYGVSLNDIAVQLAALSNLGIQGSAAGTAIKNFYKELSSDAQKIRDTFKAIKLPQLDLRDSAGNFKPLIDVVGKLSESIGKLNSIEQSTALQRLSNERGLRDLVPLMELYNQKTKDGSNELQKLYDRVADHAGYSARSALMLSMTAEKQIESVWNTLKSTLAETFKSVEPQVSLLARSFKSAFSSPEFKNGLVAITNALSGLFLTIAQNLPLIVGLVTLLTGLKVASSIVGVFQSLGTAIAGVATAFTAGTGAAATIAGSLTGLGLVIAAGTAAWMGYSYWKNRALGTDQAAAAKASTDDIIEKLQDDIKKTKEATDLRIKGMSLGAIEQEQNANVILQKEKENEQLRIGNKLREVHNALIEVDPILLGKYQKDPKAVTRQLEFGGQQDVIKGLERATQAQKAYENEVTASQSRMAEVEKLVKQQASEYRRKENVELEILKTNQKEVITGAPNVFGTDKQAAAEAKKELDSYNNSMHDLNVAIAEQVELKKRMDALGLGYEKLGKGAKAVFDIEQELTDLRKKDSLTALEQLHVKHLESLLVQARLLELQDATVQRTKEALQVAAEEKQSMETKIAKAAEEADAMERKVKAYGQLKGAAQELEVEELKSQRSRFGLDNMTEESMRLERLIAQRERYAKAKGELGQLEGAEEAKKALDKFLDPEKATRFGQILKEAFGGVGDAIGKVLSGVGEYEKRQEKAEDLRKKIAKDYKKDSQDYVQAMEAISLQQATNTINSYGDMASAAKGFFKENSKGYKAMEAAERTFRLFEMALTAQSLAKKLFATEAATGAAVAGNAVQATSAVSGAGVEVGAKMAVANANAVAGVANQANGDPYSAFPRMAAMAAIMVALGLAVGSFGGGGSSAASAEEMQKVQGTGTVFGDSDAKSKSIANALDSMKDNSEVSLKYSSQMVTALQSIDASMSGLANLVVRTYGLTSGNALGVQTGTLSKNKGDPIMNGLGMFSGPLGLLDKQLGSDSILGGLVMGLQSLWGKVRQDITDSGLYVRGTLGQLAAGGGISQYANVHKDESSFFGLKHDESDSTVFGGVDPAIARQFAKVFDGINQSLVVAGTSLGHSGSMISSTLNNLSIDIGKVSLKGLKGQDLQDAIQSVISAAADNAARAAIGDLDAFAKVGEGYYETAIRVANGVEVADYALKQLGVTAEHYSFIANKQGDVATEIIRDSLAAKEAGTTVANIIKGLDGSAKDLIDTYKKLVDIRSNMNVTGLGFYNLTTEFIDAAGGIDSLQSAMGVFTDNFFTDAQKQAMSLSKLKDQFHAIGVAMPATRQEFAQLLQTLINMGVPGQETAGKLLQLASAFDEFQQIADESVGKARSNLTDAYNRESQAIKDTQTKFTDFAKSLKDFQASLMIGSLSPLTNVQKYAQAKAQYEDIVNRAHQGDQTAIAQFQTAANNLLNASHLVNASGNGYTADFNSVATETASLAQYASQQVDVATASLEALNKQVDGLIVVNQSVLTVTQAIDALHEAMSKAGMTGDNYTAPVATAAKTIGWSDIFNSLANGTGVLGAVAPMLDGSHADGLGYVPFDGYIAELHKGERVLTAQESNALNLGNYGRKSDESLVNEIKSLREELKQLRQEQAEQTSALIGSNYDANERAANAVVDGTKDAVSLSAHKETVKIGMV